jgi:hypothetical protein
MTPTMMSHLGHSRGFHDIYSSYVRSTPKLRMYRFDKANRRFRISAPAIPTGRTLGRKAGKETVVPNKVDPQIERRPIGALRSYERNARKHSLKLINTPTRMACEGPLCPPIADESLHRREMTQLPISDIDHGWRLSQRGS